MKHYYDSVLAIIICLLLQIFNISNSSSQELHEYLSLTERVDIHGYQNGKRFDEQGIILNGSAYHPLVICQFGILSYYEFLETNDSLYFDHCINQFNYFTDKSLVHSKFEGKGIGFPYFVKIHGLEGPWYSGMTQGYAASYLLRYHQLTGDEQALEIAEKAIFLLLQDQEEGGTISTTKEGYTWIEEYPNSKRAPQVLNGFINGMIGLREYCDHFTGDSIALNTFNEVYHGFKKSLEYYHRADWSNYDRKKKKLSNLYMRYQIDELTHLMTLFPDSILDAQRRIWSAQSYNKFNKKKIQQYKYPKHNASVPSILINGNYTPQLDDSLYITPPNQIYLNSNRELKKYRKKGIQISKKKRSKMTHVLFSPDSASVQINTARFYELDLEKISRIQVFNDRSNECLFDKKIATTSEASLPITGVSFSEKNLEDLRFVFHKPSPNSDSLNIRMEFYNTSTYKKPYYSHFYSDTLELDRSVTYTSLLNHSNTDDVKVFLKHAKDPKALKKAIWKADETLSISSNFTPKKSGTYLFLIVYNYSDEASCTSQLKLTADPSIKSIKAPD